jgi:hypothetical protein
MSNKLPAIPTEGQVVPWCTLKLITLRKRVNAIKRRVKRTKNQALRESYNKRYKDFKNQYKGEILEAKLGSWKAFCTEHANSSPWKLYERSKAGFARNPVPTTLTLPDGETTTSANALLHKFFPDDSPSRDVTQHKNIRNQVAETKPPDTQAVPDFLPQEVDEVIGKLRDKKCPVPDGIDGPILKRIHRILPSF